MTSQNQYGQRAFSHATEDPRLMQEAVPQGREEKSSDSVHDTASGTPKGSSQKAHTKDRGAAYVLPLGIQKVVPEVLGRAMSDKIHDTGGGDADMGKK